MSNIIQKYFKFPKEELEAYSKRPGSCILKINSNMHITVGPLCLMDCKRLVMDHIVKSKVGYYNRQLNGIVLGVKNVKIMEPISAIRADDALLHINFNADVYIFRPEKGAILNGVVKHIGSYHIGVIFYRIFNAHLKFQSGITPNMTHISQKVKFCIKNYDIQSFFPYIEGELLSSDNDSKKNNHVSILTTKLLDIQYFLLILYIVAINRYDL